MLNHRTRDFRVSVLSKTARGARQEALLRPKRRRRSSRAPSQEKKQVAIDTQQASVLLAASEADTARDGRTCKSRDADRSARQSAAASDARPCSRARRRMFRGASHGAPRRQATPNFQRRRGVGPYVEEKQAIGFAISQPENGETTKTARSSTAEQSSPVTSLSLSGKRQPRSAHSVSAGAFRLGLERGESSVTCGRAALLSMSRIFRPTSLRAQSWSHAPC